MTNQELNSKTFVMNYNLKSAIEEYLKTNKESSFLPFRICYGRTQNSAWKNRPQLRIIISLLGSSNVGKSTLVEHLRQGPLRADLKLPVTIATELHFLHLDYLFENEYVVIIQLNDCRGQDTFESVYDGHFRDCHGAVLMIDSMNLKSFERLQDYWFKRLCEKSSFEYVETVLACNKIDLLENASPDHCKEYFAQVHAFAAEHQISTFNTSSIRGDNVQALFHRLITNILNNQLLLTAIKEKSSKKPEEIKVSSSTVTVNSTIRSQSKQTKSAAKSSSGCC